MFISTAVGTSSPTEIGGTLHHTRQRFLRVPRANRWVTLCWRDQQHTSESKEMREGGSVHTERTARRKERKCDIKRKYKEVEEGMCR